MGRNFPDYSGHLKPGLPMENCNRSCTNLTSFFSDLATSAVAQEDKRGKESVIGGQNPFLALLELNLISNKYATKE